jgi:hypothetical protein
VGLLLLSSRALNNRFPIAGSFAYFKSAFSDVETMAQGDIPWAFLCRMMGGTAKDLG